MIESTPVALKLLRHQANAGSPASDQMDDILNSLCYFPHRLETAPEGARSAWLGHPQFMVAPHPPITRRVMRDPDGVI
jgi:hypothetical protein